MQANLFIYVAPIGYYNDQTNTLILIIDNYDSFTFNLVDLIRQEEEVSVYRNDEISLEEVKALKPRGILISPGPGRPRDSGVSYPIVERLQGKVPILGVCLGHQLIGEVLGAQVKHALRPMHGKRSKIQHDGIQLFQGLSSPLTVMRYHSLVLDPASIPPTISVSAHTQAGEIMGIRAREKGLWGVQFHPESIGSEGGTQLIRNWLQCICS
ncbi:MAG: aminodeoxychorismate/anthranilate synthase component II [Bacteroidota bacterium]